MNDNAAYTYLLNHGVKPSVQRLAVMEYLMDNHSHPTVDDIYTALVSKIPTLSKTTVYNTLKLLVGHNAAHMLTIDERNTCFDGVMEPHAHCFCTRCGKILDVKPYSVDAPSQKLPDGFEVENVELYYRGVCAECRKKA